MEEFEQIKEEDIFRYVHGKETLPLDKLKIIENNWKIFIKDIEICKKLTETKNIEFLKIADAQNFIIEKTKIITLYPQFQKKNDTVFILAAASSIVENKITAQTFLDNDSKYLLKILSSNEKSKILLFTDESQVLHNFKLKLYSTSNVFFCENENFSIPPEELNKIEKIELEIL